ncbi:SMI1/KNR4 family protein [Pseudomonas sp. K2I15]|uniref:SMI1/KNR4 family protein n=1 Tax=unclassified Pseudomonas TaxID=196821 RepID=UPI000B4D3875|nr:SMI1/KNR4 family protein [Pseudomonas sp. K2I15]OWP71541.1 SMI1/KNR4 family protein [Pseudomonas sp. K2I15]
MNNTSEIRQLISEITTAVGYEGDFGDRINDVDLILNKVDAASRIGVPEDYLEFLATFGFGELDCAFYVSDGPVRYAAQADGDAGIYAGLYVFAGDSCEGSYAFDTRNNWAIVELDAEIDEVEVVSEDFSSFILNQLAYVKDLIERRQHEAL